MGDVMQQPYIKIPMIRRNGAFSPMRASTRSAGYDLCAHVREPVLIAPGRRALIPTGVALAMPEGTCALVLPRRDKAVAMGLTVLNAPEVIDADMRGEIEVLLINLGDKDCRIESNSRIAQLVIVHHYPLVFTPVAGGRDESGEDPFGPTNFQPTRPMQGRSVQSAPKALDDSIDLPLELDIPRCLLTKQPPPEQEEGASAVPDASPQTNAND